MQCTPLTVTFTKIYREFFKTFVCNPQPNFQPCLQDTVHADALAIYSLTSDLQSYSTGKKMSRVFGSVVVVAF